MKSEKRLMSAVVYGALYEIECHDSSQSVPSVLI